MAYTRIPAVDYDPDKIEFAYGPGANPVTEPDPSGLKQTGYDDTVKVSEAELNWLIKAPMDDLRVVLKGGALPQGALDELVDAGYLDTGGKAAVVRTSAGVYSVGPSCSNGFTQVASDGIRLAGWDETGKKLYVQGADGTDWTEYTYSKLSKCYGLAFVGEYILGVWYDSGVGGLRIIAIDSDGNEYASLSPKPSSYLSDPQGSIPIRQDGVLCIVADDGGGTYHPFLFHFSTTAGTISWLGSGAVDTTSDEFMGAGLSQNHLVLVPGGGDTIRIYDVPWGTTSAATHGRNATADYCVTSSVNVTVTCTSEKILLVWEDPVSWYSGGSSHSNTRVVLLQLSNGVDTLYTTSTPSDAYETVWRKLDSSTGSAWGMLTQMGFVVVAREDGSTGDLFWWVIDTTHQGRMVAWGKNTSKNATMPTNGNPASFYGGGILTATTSAVGITNVVVQEIYALMARLADQGTTRFPVSMELVVVGAGQLDG